MPNNRPFTSIEYKITEKPNLMTISDHNTPLVSEMLPSPLSPRVDYSFQTIKFYAAYSEHLSNASIDIPIKFYTQCCDLSRLLYFI